MSDAALTLSGRQAALDKPQSPARIFWRRFTANWRAIASAILLLIIVIMVVFAPLFTPYERDAQNLRTRFQPPSLQHPMGTDDLGRDVYTRAVRRPRLAGRGCAGRARLAARRHQHRPYFRLFRRLVGLHSQPYHGDLSLCAAPFHPDLAGRLPARPGRTLGAARHDWADRRRHRSLCVDGMAPAWCVLLPWRCAGRSLSTLLMPRASRTAAS